MIGQPLHFVARATGMASMVTPALEPKPPPTSGAMTRISLCETCSALAIRFRAANGDCDDAHRVTLPFSSIWAMATCVSMGTCWMWGMRKVRSTMCSHFGHASSTSAAANFEMVGDVGSRFGEDEIGILVFSKSGDGSTGLFLKRQTQHQKPVRVLHIPHRSTPQPSSRSHR